MDDRIFYVCPNCGSAITVLSDLPLVMVELDGDTDVLLCDNKLCDWSGRLPLKSGKPAWPPPRD